MAIVMASGGASKKYRFYPSDKLYVDAGGNLNGNGSGEQVKEVYFDGTKYYPDAIVRPNGTTRRAVAVGGFSGTTPLYINNGPFAGDLVANITFDIRYEILFTSRFRISYEEIETVSRSDQFDYSASMQRPVRYYWEPSKDRSYSCTRYNAYRPTHFKIQNIESQVSSHSYYDISVSSWSHPDEAVDSGEINHTGDVDYLPTDSFDAYEYHNPLVNALATHTSYTSMNITLLRDYEYFNYDDYDYETGNDYRMYSRAYFISYFENIYNIADDAEYTPGIL